MSEAGAGGWTDVRNPDVTDGGPRRRRRLA